MTGLTRLPLATQIAGAPPSVARAAHEGAPSPALSTPRVAGTTILGLTYIRVLEQKLIPRALQAGCCGIRFCPGTTSTPLSPAEPPARGDTLGLFQPHAEGLAAGLVWRVGRRGLWNFGSCWLASEWEQATYSGRDLGNLFIFSQLSGCWRQAESGQAMGCRQALTPGSIPTQKRMSECRYLPPTHPTPTAQGGNVAQSAQPWQVSQGRLGLQGTVEWSMPNK